MGRRHKGRRLAGRGKSAAAVVGATAMVATPPVNEAWLEQEFFGQKVPKSEEWRTHYGKALDLALIDYALRQAELGSMMVLTDIGRETAQLDGHLSSVLQKRLNRLAALPIDISPAKGPRVDTKRAEAYATYVRDMLDGIPRWKQFITNMAWGIFDARAAHEKQWTWLDGDWALTRLDWIHPRRLSFGACRDLRVIDTGHAAAGGFRDIGFPLEQVPYKFAIYRPQLFNDYPEREGLLPRTLYWSRFARFGVHERNLLLELFGRPWRIIKHQVRPDGTPVSTESSKSAYEQVKQLGYNTVARLPVGFELDIHQPFTGAGQISGDVIDYANKVTSKLVLGNTGTTDAVSTGLGSSIGNAHVTEEDLIIWADAERLAEVIEDQIVDAIIAVNFGPSEVVNAPKFAFRTEAPSSREEEGRIIDIALKAGVPVPLEQARQKLGIREIKPGEPYVAMVQRPVGFGQVALPPQPEIVYPLNKAPAAGELAPPPSASDGLGNLPPDGVTPGLPSPDPSAPSGGPNPPALPAGTQGPDVDEPDAIAELCELMNEHQVAACEHGRKNVCEWCGIERERSLEIKGGEPHWIIKWKPLRRPPPAPAAPPVA
jgi:phage gp29-like protein